MSDQKVSKKKKVIDRFDEYKEGSHAIETVDSDFSKISDLNGQMFLRLDLASGNKVREGFKSVDVSKNCKPDYEVDLSKFPYPFEDNSVFELSCSHYVEHCSDLISFMNECYRILKPLSQFTISAPYYTSINAFKDPTHVRAINEDSFKYFNAEWRKTAGIEDVDYYEINCNFEIVNTMMVFNPEWKFRGDDVKVWAARHHFNVVDEIVIILRSLKNIERYK